MKTRICFVTFCVLYKKVKYIKDIIRSDMLHDSVGQVSK